MSISIEKFLSKYFSPKQLKEALSNMGIPVGTTKKERIERIVENWRSHNRDWYELLDYLDWGDLSQICDDFNIRYSDYAREDTLCNKIEGERVLDFRNIQKKSTQKKSDEKPSIFNILGKNINIGNNNLIGDSEKSFRLSKTQLVVTIIVGMFVIAGVIAGLTPDSNSQNTDSIIECMTGEDGLTYKNCELGFEISRPNIDWYYNYDVVEQLRQGDALAPMTHYLGGIIIERSVFGKVIVVVNNPPNVDSINFKESIERDAEGWKDIFDSGEVKFHFSPEGNSAEVQMNASSSEYGFDYQWKIRVEKKDDKIFMVASQLFDPETVPEKIIKELEMIKESFRYL